MRLKSDLLQTKVKSTTTTTMKQSEMAKVFAKCSQRCRDMVQNIYKQDWMQLGVVG
jgi:hypothetical protein